MQLIERGVFLARLQEELDCINEGDGRCVFITGEAGIGKTSLVKTFCRRQESCSIFQGACDALFAPRPLAPVFDVIWQIRSDLRSDTHSIEERSNLFLEFFHEVKKTKERVIIVFEDVHWADEATLDFIKFFGRRIDQLKCLLILTFRDDEVNSRHPLRNVLGALSPDSVSRISLQPLSKQAVSKLADEKGFDAEDVYKISGGNPFYVNEILASYSPGVPRNVRDAILSVYERQEERTKEAWQILSVIPEGLDFSRFTKLRSTFGDGLDHCFDLNIIINKNDKIVFKHELYRRTIETSLSPFKRLELNKRILDLFLASFEENGEIERIVQYAKNADENHIVVQYAPQAAKQAAAVGAHTEAARLFLTAIECSQGDDMDQIIEFYEAYAYESYLTNQMKEAIIYEGKALKIWQTRNEIEKISHSLRFLSRLWWLDGNREKAEDCGRQAILILEAQPLSKVKAMAYSNMSQLKLFSEELIESIDLGEKAVQMARELEDTKTLCHSLGNVGASLWRLRPSDEEGKRLLLEGLQIAVDNSYHEYAAQAYSIIIGNCISFKEFDLAEQMLSDSIVYCEERDLDLSKNYKLFQKSRVLLEKGNWNEAMSLAKDLLRNPLQPTIVKIGALATLATIEVRKGLPEALDHLQEVKSYVTSTKEHYQIVPVMIACLQYEWLEEGRVLEENDLALCVDLAKATNSITLNSELRFWLWKVRKLEMRVAERFEPYQLLESGQVEAAARFWKSKSCPFDEAIALYEGSQENKRAALQIFYQLSADKVTEKLKIEMRAEGIQNIPRGIRDSTKSNPAQLTTREVDVLRLLQKGYDNRMIANTLFISPRTAENHISNILFKLAANSRSKAVTEAVRLGILN